MTNVFSLLLLPRSGRRAERKRKRMATKCCETISFERRDWGMTRSSWF
jgi:hypothetical protein